MESQLTFRKWRTPWHSREGTDAFGIEDDQICTGFVQTCGWYNGNGEMIGFGDLSPQNFCRLATELDPDELFIVLREEKAIAGRERPGQDYVAEHCRYIIRRGAMYLVAGPESPEPSLPIQVITQPVAAAVVKGAWLLQRVFVQDGDGVTPLGLGWYVGEAHTYIVNTPKGLRSLGNAEERPSDEMVCEVGGELMEDDTNPKIVLDDGRVVYGRQVWWQEHHGEN